MISTQYQPKTITAGDSLSISCNAMGYPIPSVSFAKDGVVKGGDQVTNDTDSMAFVTMSTLEIGSVEPSDSGTYFCVATNSYGPEANEEILYVIVECKHIRYVDSLRSFIDDLLLHSQFYQKCLLVLHLSSTFLERV